MIDKITPFPQGNTLVLYNQYLNKLVVGNSCGIIKIFDINQLDLEPQSIDISENITNLCYWENNLLVTNTSGNVEIVDITSVQSAAKIYRSELPLRDVIYINNGARILVGGDDNKLIIIDSASKQTQTVPLPDQLVNLAYNYTGEMLSLSLSNGDLQIYSLINETPALMHTLAKVLPTKIHTSLDAIDYNSEHKDELVCSKALWSNDGQYLVSCNSDNVIQIHNRSNWTQSPKQIASAAKIIDILLVQGYIITLCGDSTVKIYNFDTLAKVNEIAIENTNSLLLNLSWNDNTLFVGTNEGNIYILNDIVQEQVPSKTSINSLFLDEAAEEDEENDLDGGNDTDALLFDSDDEEAQSKSTTATSTENGHKLHEEDSLIIDQDDDDYENGGSGLSSGYLARKRHKPNGFSTPPPVHHEVELRPFSPGSTPWSSDASNGASTTSANRRYLTMNSIGYAWCVKSSENAHQTITVSFFDRSIQKDYHFTDYYNYDLCSINKRGVLLGASGFDQKSKIDNGIIYYRNHDSEQDSWERKIPLLKNEYLTSISLTNVDTENTYNADSLIIVGTNFGYMRIFNAFGVCINILKTPPVVTIISSSSATIFTVNQVANQVYTFSIIDVNQDYKFIQQNVILPIKQHHESVPLIKGIFFNEYNDPCIVPGHDDTLLVLQSWRESQNSKWTPILNCHHSITNSDTKKNWKCWPLGVYDDKLNCIILKHHNHYPKFPLPLPIEIEIKLPINNYLNKAKDKEDDDEDDASSEIVQENSPEENFLRSVTMGKLISDTLNDDNNDHDNEEIMARINKYSIVFDKSLLIMFGESCKESKLNKALSIAKMIRTDKALVAAAKISERMQFMTLANKIAKLREDLVNLEDEKSV